jgi:hypothetical protein
VRGSTTYSTWVAVTWDLTGAVIGETAKVPDPDPSIAGAAHSGSRVGGANYPSCDNSGPYDNDFYCVSVPAYDNGARDAVQTALHVINQAACSATSTAYCTYRGILTSGADLANALPEPGAGWGLASGLVTLAALSRRRCARRARETRHARSCFPRRDGTLNQAFYVDPAVNPDS